MRLMFLIIKVQVELWTFIDGLIRYTLLQLVSTKCVSITWLLEFVNDDIDAIAWKSEMMNNWPNEIDVYHFWEIQPEITVGLNIWHNGNNLSIGFDYVLYIS